MALPARIPRAPKRSTRWRSQAHLNHVRSHSCSLCGAIAAIEVAHVRIGSGAGIGQKPDDWRTVSLCRGCHNHQHTIGEESFWKNYREASGQTVDELIDAFCKASPKAVEIAALRKGTQHD